jgi:hypothetical protein
MLSHTPSINVLLPELVIEKRMEKDGLWSPPSPPSTQQPIAKKPRKGR